MQRVLSVLLVLAMLVSFVPTYAVAEETAAAEDAATVSAEEVEGAEAETVVDEVEPKVAEATEAPPVETVSETTAQETSPQTVGCLVEFVCETTDFTLQLYRVNDDGQLGEEVHPQEDRTYLLVPGKYFYYTKKSAAQTVEGYVEIDDEEELKVELVFEDEVEETSEYEAVGGTNLTCTQVTQAVNEYRRILEEWCNNHGTNTAYWNANIRGNNATQTLKNQADAGDYTSCVTNKPCVYTGSHLNANGCTSNMFTGVTKGLAQCHAFADYMAYVVFRETANSHRDKIRSQDGYDFSNFNYVPGDIIFFNDVSSNNQHFIFVYDTDETFIYYVAGNDDGRCGIKFRTKTWKEAREGYQSSSFRPIGGVLLSPATDADNCRGQYRPPVQSAPSAPTNFTAVYVDNERAKLSWSPSSGATSYEVQYWSIGSNAWKTDTSYSSGTSYTSTGLKNYSSWTFRVRAVNSAGKSDWVSCTYEKTHTHSYKQEFEAAHPHKVYMKCSSCGDWYYTGATTTVDSCTQCHPPVQQVYLDLNGYLDGRDSDSLENFGTCDVYINDVKVADDCTDFYRVYPVGTKYSIQDIRATDGHKYIGEKSSGKATIRFEDDDGKTTIRFEDDDETLSGTLNSNTDVVLEYETIAPMQVSLKLKACLNDEEIDSLDGIGTCDVYINGEKVADGCSQFNAAYPVGSTYSIKNVSAQTGYRFKGVLPKYVDAAGNTTVYFGSLEGTLTGNSEIVLDFETTGHSGTCGDNLTWNLNTAGTLTITGTGAMWDYEWCQDGDIVYSSAPWAGLEITDLALEEGITRIGDCAFLDCTTIFAPLDLPSTLQEIGDATFSGCYGLYGELYLPESINAIGACAFQGCSGLIGTLNLPSGISYIGSAVFNGCSGLTGTISIPQNVQYIGDWAFRDCSGFTGKLVIPDNVAEIDEYAFAGCTGIEQTKIPANLQIIGEGAFEDCSGLTDVFYSGSLQQWNRISVGENNEPLLNATLHCTSDTEKRPLAQSVTLLVDGEDAPREMTIDLYDYPYGMPQPSLTAIVLPEDAAQTVIWSSSAPKVAAVEEDGSVTVLSPGTTVIKAVATDGSKKAGQVTLNVVRTDRSPWLGSSTLTLNGVSTSGTQVDLVENGSNQIQGVRVDDDRFEAEYENNLLTIAAKETIAKGTYKTVLTADTDRGSYSYPLTINVTQILPKLNAKQSNKFNLFYQDSESVLTITGGEVEEAELTGNSAFMLENEDGQWIIRYADPENVPAKPGTKATLRVLFAGYNTPVTKAITIATVNTMPKLKLNPAASVLNTVLTDSLEVQARLIGADDDDLSVWTDTPGVEVYLDDDVLTVELSTAKACTVNIYVQSDNWAKPIKLTHKVTVTSKKPTLKAVSNTLKLNSYFPSETSFTGLTLSQGNIYLSTVELTPTAKNASAAAESEKLSVYYDTDSEQIAAEILDSSIKNGTYSFACVGTLEDGTAISGGTVKVSVTNTLPKAKLSASTVKLNKRLIEEEATVKVTLTGGNGYTVTGFEDLPDFMWYEDGILTVTMPEKGGAYPLYATVSRGSEEVTLPTAVKLTVQIYDKAPSFQLSAKGKLDVLDPDSEVVCTPKLTNALGTVTDVQLTGEDAERFDVELVNGTIHLTLAEPGDSYSTKATYKVVPVLTICSQEVTGSAISIKVTQSPLKLAALPNRTVCTSQASPLLQTLSITNPTAASIGEITLNAKTTAALKNALNTVGGIQVTGSTVAFPAKAFTGLKPGNYTVILDVTPVNAAADSKPTQAKFTLTVKK